MRVLLQEAAQQIQEGLKQQVVKQYLLDHGLPHLTDQRKLKLNIIFCTYYHSKVLGQYDKKKKLIFLISKDEIDQSIQIEINIIK